MKTIVVATHNPKKAGEMLTILRRGLPHIEFKTLADYPGAPEPEETGATYQENALIKARSAARHTGEWSLADDAGLEIDAMPSDLGVQSKRFAGDTTFDEKMQIVLDALTDTADERRSARFRCCIALVSPNGEETTIEDTCEGRIARERSGNGGFGYDPIFYLSELGCTMADLTPDQKHAVSHRGKVLRRLIDSLKDEK
jgi:XTP/dITP diphosphohydrolase